MTTRRIELKGAKITYAGRLFKEEWPALARKIKKGGGAAHDQIDASLTCFVAGGRAGAKATQARSRGVPIITEAQLLTLIEQGYLEITEEDPFATKATFDESVAELRGIFGGAPTSAGWTRCLEIVEGCDPDRVDDLLSYLTPFLDKWDGAKMPRWEEDAAHPLMKHTPKYWQNGLPDAEVRVAPPLWLYEIIQDRPHPKHALIRALNLEGLKLNGAIGAKLFKNPHLTGVRVLNLGIQNNLPKGFFSALYTHDLMRTVRELWLYKGDQHIKECWTAESHTFDVLERVRCYEYFDKRALAALPCMQGVTITKTPSLY